MPRELYAYDERFLPMGMRFTFEIPLQLDGKGTVQRQKAVRLFPSFSQSFFKFFAFGRIGA